LGIITVSEAWINVLNWTIIQELVKKTTGTILTEEMKLKGIALFRQKHPNNDEIYELEPEDIEKELFYIYMQMLKGRFQDVAKTLKNPPEIKHEAEFDEELLEEMENQFGFIPEINYLSKMMKNNPELRKLFKKRTGKGSDEDEAAPDNFYI
jgi:ribosomal protein L29